MRMPFRTIGRGACIAFAITALPVGAVAVSAATQGQQPAADPTAGLPTDGATRASLKAAFESNASKETAKKAANAPAPLLPAEERPKWIAAWNKMVECQRAHGFDGATALGPNYGDGSTPMPGIVADGPNAATAIAACPLDTKSFNEAVVKEAVEQASRNRKAG